MIPPARTRRILLAAAALLSLGSCYRRPDTGVVVVSAIGDPPALPDGSRNALDTASRLLADATAQGLVRFDAGGQIEPGLAQRWAVLDDGSSYIFKLHEATWADGKPVTAEQVVTILKRQLRVAARNPLLPFLSAIDEIVVMTPQVIEVRLSRPRPDLLKLFAQPELTLIRAAKAGGSGPMRIIGEGRAPLLRPVPEPGRAAEDDVSESLPADDVRLIGERAATAVARFAARESDLVAGGTFADWPLVAAAAIAPANIRTDPAAGLFGLAVVDRSDFLGEAGNRLIVAQAIDRAALAAAMGTAWQPADHILPEALDSAAPPVTPAWTLLTQAQRVAGARAQVARWAQPLRLRIAMPRGSGATLVYAHIAAALIAIRISPERVDLNAPADLRLVDAVAPYDSARWYLATACAACGEEAQAALEAARTAPTLAARASAIATADRALDADGAFITLARPLRWSLVAGRLVQWQPNARAWHPLNRLRRAP
ncbi:ABC transporter substrate-binding protein [Sphingomonas sp.]|jgi:peptide/nickel transport system substrate-binding protein|uniref:ABC transporter substrate-binding protein n=1 Tax=Sphingomonas sp. TaxID=28214 RepID=UPI002ED9A976